MKINAELKKEILDAIRNAAVTHFAYYVDNGWFTLNDKIIKGNGFITENFKLEEKGKKFGAIFAKACELQMEKLFNEDSGKKKEETLATLDK